MSVRPLRIGIQNSVYAVLPAFGAMPEEHVKHFMHDRPASAVLVRKTWQVLLSPEWRTKENRGLPSGQRCHCESVVGGIAASFVSCAARNTRRAADKLNSPASIEFIRHCTETHSDARAGWTACP